jgi:hypothetical protein
LVEFQLCFLIARSREVNNAESLRRSVGMLLGDADAYEKYKGEHDSTVWQGRWHVSAKIRIVAQQPLAAVWQGEGKSRS